MKVHEGSLSSDLQVSILKPAEQTGWGVVVRAGRLPAWHSPRAPARTVAWESASTSSRVRAVWLQKCGTIRVGRRPASPS